MHIKILQKTIPSNLKIRNIRFYNDSELRLISMKAFPTQDITNLLHKESVDDSVYEKEKYVNMTKGGLFMTNFTLFNALRNINEVIIPSHIKFINDRCFKNCKNLRSVVFSDDSELCSI